MSILSKAGLSGIILAASITSAAAIQGGVISDTQMRVGPGDEFAAVANAKTGMSARIMSCPETIDWCLARIDNVIGWLTKSSLGEMEKAKNGMTSNGGPGSMTKPTRIVFAGARDSADDGFDPFRNHHIRVWGTRHVSKAWNFGRATHAPTQYIGFDAETREFGPARIRLRSNAWNFGRWRYVRVD